MASLSHYPSALPGVSQKNSSPEDLSDETFNRKATLLKSVSVVLCCSPVCEKQSLFALFQSYKENNIEEPLIKKLRANHLATRIYSLINDVLH